MAQAPQVTTPAGDVTTEAIAFGTIGGAAIAVDQLHPLPVSDAPWRGVVALAPDVPTTPARGIMIAATAAGAVQVRLADTSVVSLPVGTGLTLLPLAVAAVLSAGTTATASVWNLV